MWQRIAQHRAPEGHLVVGFAVRPPNAPPGAKQRVPKSDGQSSHHSIRGGKLTTRLRQLHFHKPDTAHASFVQPRSDIRLPGRTVARGELFVHGIAERHLQSLQHPVERGTQGDIP